MPTTLQECIELFASTTPGERSDQTVITLCESLTKHFVLFQSLDPHHLEGIAQFSSLDYALKDSIVIRQGDKGHTFHMLLSGRVCCYKAEKTLQKPSTLMIDPRDPRTPKSSHEIKLQRRFASRFVTAFIPGDVFGERALLNDNGKRESSIVCTEDAQILTLSRDAFLAFLSDETSKLSIKMCIDVLKKSSKVRSEDDIEVLLKYTQNCAFIQQLETDFQKILVREMTFSQFERHQTVFLQNDESDGFFVILHGSAGVYVREKNDNGTPQIFEDKLRQSYGEQVAILSAGDAFGERGILKRGLRAATIRAETKLTCMRMSNRKYDKILRPLMGGEESKDVVNNGVSVNIASAKKIVNIPPEKRTEQDIKQLTEFLFSLAFFKQLPIKYVAKLATSIESKHFGTNELVMCQGDKGDNFYIILEGSVSVHIQKDVDKLNALRKKIEENRAKREDKKIDVETSRDASVEQSKNQGRKSLIVGKRDFDKRSLEMTEYKTNKLRFVNTINEALNAYNSKNIQHRLQIEEQRKLKLPQTLKIRSRANEVKQYGDLIVNLTVGDSFGEAALISNQPRKASVVARDDIQLLVISQTLYESVVAIHSVIFDPVNCMNALKAQPEDRTRADIESLTKFCHTMPFFHDIPTSTVRSLAKVVRLVKCKPHQIVLLQGEKVNKHFGHFFVILRGSVSIHKIDAFLDKNSDPTISSRTLSKLFEKSNYKGTISQRSYHKFKTKMQTSTTSTGNNLMEDLHNLKADIKSNRKRGKNGYRGSNLRGQYSNYLSTSEPIPFENLDRVESNLGSCKVVLTAGDTFGQIGLKNYIFEKQDAVKATGTDQAPQQDQEDHKDVLHIPTRTASIITRQESEFLVINIREFREHIATRQLPFSPSLALKALGKQPQARTLAEINALVEMTLQLVFFQQLPTSIIKKICEQATMRKLETGDVLCLQGDQSGASAFWITLEGEMEVFKKQNMEADTNAGVSSDKASNKTKTTYQARKAISYSGIDGLGSIKRVTTKHLDAPQADETQGESNYGLSIGIVKKGDAVGERTLVTKKPRTATVVATEQTMLMQISRSTFDKYIQSVAKCISFRPEECLGIIKRASSKEHDLHGKDILVNLIKMIPSLRHVDANDFKKYCNAKFIKSGKAVFNWRAEPRECMFLLKGSVKIIDPIKNKTIALKQVCGDKFGDIELLIHGPRLFSAFASRGGAYCLLVNEEGYFAAFGKNSIESKLIKLLRYRKILGDEADRHDIAVALQIMADPIHLKRNAHLNSNLGHNNAADDVYEATSDSDEETVQPQRNSTQFDLTRGNDIYILLQGEMKCMETKSISKRKEIDLHDRQNINKTFLRSPLRRRKNRIASYLALLQTGSIFSKETADELVLCESEVAIVIKLNLKKLKLFVRSSALRHLLLARNEYLHLLVERRDHLKYSERQREEMDVSHHFLKFAPSSAPVRHKIRPSMYRKSGEHVLDYANRVAMQVRTQFRQPKNNKSQNCWTTEIPMKSSVVKEASTANLHSRSNPVEAPKETQRRVFASTI